MSVVIKRYKDVLTKKLSNELLLNRDFYNLMKVVLEWMGIVEPIKQLNEFRPKELMNLQKQIAF